LRKLLQHGVFSPGLIVVIAFVLRFGILVHMQGVGPRPVRGYAEFGYETGQIARALANGEGYSSPLNSRRTGPTAWLTPVYPGVLAGAFKLLGTFSYASFICILSLNCIFSAFTCWPIFLIGERAFGAATGAVAAWFWALLAAGVTFQVDWIWDTSLAALLCASIILATLTVAESSRVAAWTGYGALWALGALTNPSLVSMLPFLLAWLVQERRGRHLPALRCVSAAVLTFFLAVSPWFVRNYVMFGQGVPFRSNLGLELWLGNNEKVPSNWAPWMHPNDDPREGDIFQRMGEIPYMAEKRREAFAFISAHPADFVALCFNRILVTWTGASDPLVDMLRSSAPLALVRYLWNFAFSALAFGGLLLSVRRKNRTAAVFGVVLGIFPLIYYITHVSLRYRYPIDPIMTVLAAYAICGWLPGSTGQKSSPPATAVS
jgi:4-amino-4-deoxy-L-arabinose transferase-like glycosyltransferase